MLSNEEVRERLSDRVTTEGVFNLISTRDYVTPAPINWIYIVDNEGNYLQDNQGNYLVDGIAP